MAESGSPKKRNMFKRFFSKKSCDEFEVDKPKPARTTKTSPRSQSIDVASTSYVIDDKIADAPVGLKKKQLQHTSGSDVTERSGARKVSTAVLAKRKRNRKESAAAKVDADQPLDFPCTPELILEYHKQKPFLSSNEEWLLVELNEYECLVESEEMIRMIAKHSKFFEVEPDELWVEFFEFVEQVSCYDDVINYDVWQEFRDKKYLC